MLKKDLTGSELYGIRLRQLRRKVWFSSCRPKRPMKPRKGTGISFGKPVGQAQVSQEVLHTHGNAANIKHGVPHEDCPRRSQEGPRDCERDGINMCIRISYMFIILFIYIMISNGCVLWYEPSSYS